MMRNWLTNLTNHLWVTLYKRKHQTFERSLSQVEETQEQILLELLAKNQDTAYGRKYSFDTITDIATYQQQVPLTTYDDYLHYIKQMLEGEEQVLTAENPLMFELSSGTTSASKYIPYTQTLKDEFQRGIAPWIYDMYTGKKGLTTGKAYWSITPVAHERQWTKGGIPIGFEEDGEYFGALERLVLNQILTVPNVVKEIDDILTFRYVTLLFLLKEKNLSMISVWNPSFLILLLKPLQDWARQLLEDLATGELNPPGELKEEIRLALRKKLGKSSKRSQELRAIFYKKSTDPGATIGQADPTASTLYEQIWPNLQLISCWTDANAAIYLPEIRSYFPNVELQGKGLLATEGMISIPRWGEEGAVLTVCSHFYEFIELGSDPTNPTIKTASQLEVGQTYSVVITTGGGFYRYQLQDLVQVVGFTQDAPRIKFVGKEAKVSDYFGEKLNEHHVHQILQQLFTKYDLEPTFYMVAPEKDETGRYFYVLYLEMPDDDTRDRIDGERYQLDREPGRSWPSKQSVGADHQVTEGSEERESVHQLAQDSDKEPDHEIGDLADQLGSELEAQLQDNYHYSYCRQLEQLHPARIFLIDQDGLEQYLVVCQEQGQKLGDIKPTVLHTRTGWSTQFPGKYLKQ